MAYKRVEDVRAWQRRRYRRQTAERLARGLCPKCGKRAPAPERSKCRQCLEQRRAADRASYARAKAEGRLYGGSDAEARRKNARARSKRRYHERSDAGLCVRCGESEPVEGSPSCESCHEARNARERALWNARRAAGLCGACGEPAPDGTARCASCAAFQQGRPLRAAYGRKQYARRRAQSRCTDCGQYSAGASRCPECARTSYLHSAEHRGLPVAPSRFRVIAIETGEDLGVWETEAEVRACLAFARLDPDAVVIETDVSVMGSLTSW